MGNIQVKTDKEIDYNIKVKSIYMRLIEILSAVKLVGGNMFLNKTIHNHPKIKNFMLEYLKNDILDLEREILELED